MVAVSLPHRGRLFGPLLVMLATVPIGACSPKYADQSSIYPMQRDCVGFACPPLPAQVAVMKDAWDAFNNGYFDQATKKVDEVINTWGPKATEEKKTYAIVSMNQGSSSRMRAWFLQLRPIVFVASVWLTKWRGLVAEG